MRSEGVLGSLAAKVSFDIMYLNPQASGLTTTIVSGKRYGDPMSDRDGCEGVGLHYPRSRPTGPIRTLQYHLKGGWLTFWLEQQGDHWRCFESLWVRDGVSF